MTQLVPMKQRLAQFMQRLEVKDSEISAALPDTGQKARAKVALQILVRDNPDLLKCTENGTLFNAFLKVCMFRLELGTEAHIVPYGDTAVFIPDYKGLCKLARRNDEIQDLYAVAVYDCDTFVLAGNGGNVEVKHELNISDPNYGNQDHIIAAYAVCVWKSNYRRVEPMNRTQIDHIRAKSKMGNSGAWKNDYGEMAKKTAIRRLAKTIPQHPDFAEALELDNRADIGKRQFPDAIDIEAESTEPEVKAEAEAEPEPEATTATKRKTLDQQITELSTKLDATDFGELLAKIGKKTKQGDDIDTWSDEAKAALVAELQKV